MAGATYDPLRDELFTAARGGGAFLGSERIRHSGRTELLGALLVTGFPYDIHENHEEPLRLLPGTARGEVRAPGYAPVAKARIAGFGPRDRACDRGHAPREDAFGEILDSPGDRHR